MHFLCFPPQCTSSTWIGPSFLVVFLSTSISTSVTSVPDVFVGDVSLATKADWTLPLRPCNAGSAAGRLGSLGRSHDIPRYTSCCCMLQIIAMDLI